ncbi:hypothetical protein RHGRI_024138 [Rhododendron griersonianum]|uniref:Uncharacterized protein n=2 Tax=Rhododendron TaxID=4346 RepID=A0AAV6JBH2_9ERIC|nr:hypothetical protein RHGRI_024138 [Rhododendron griersonianum]
MRIAMLKAMWPNTVQETMLVLLQQMLHKVLVCSRWLLREQGFMPLLQQLEDQERRPQMPLEYQIITSFIPH